MPLAAFVYAVIAFVQMLGYPGDQRSRDVQIYQWIAVGSFKVNVGLQLDQLSICFVLLITGVGSLIHIFSVGYMAHDEGLAPVLRLHEPVPGGHAAARAGRQLPAAVRRWEGVGLASYLLIGFWQFKPAAAVAGQEGVHRQPGR